MHINDWFEISYENKIAKKYNAQVELYTYLPAGYLMKTIKNF